MSSCVTPEQYAVEFLPASEIVPSPENDEVYGAVGFDETMLQLISSIKLRGLEEPIIVSADNYIISGHRRYFACVKLGLDEIPIRRKHFSRSEELEHWPKILTEYNPQRVKNARSLLKEALMRHADEPQQLLRRYRKESVDVDATFADVSGTKVIEDIGDRQAEFLNACVDVVNRLKKFWPLQVRQIHYNLLNNPPLTQVVKRSTKPKDHWRYRNTQDCYNRLVNLLVPARYHGHISWNAIDDPTRPQFENSGFRSLAEYIEQEMESFLCDYHLDRQLSQPRHIEVLGEKNTLLQTLKPICEEFYVPLTIGRGCCSHPVWRDIAGRFRRSGKERMSLLVLSDYDAAGFYLAEDAARSLRDLWEIPLDFQRVGVNREQIDEQELQGDFNPEKAEGAKLKKFVERTGSNQSWEIEALDPNYLQEQVRRAILENLDKDAYEETIAQENSDVDQLAEIRSGIMF